jgi:hypothetical protein
VGVDSGVEEYYAKNETSSSFCGVIRKLALRRVKLGQSGNGTSLIRCQSLFSYVVMIRVGRSPVKLRIGYLKKQTSEVSRRWCHMIPLWESVADSPAIVS